MDYGSLYRVNPGWRLLLTDMKLNIANILKRADLPGDLFGRRKATLNTDEYFRLWRSVEEEANDTTIGLWIGQAISAEAFDPPIFAAFCSADLNTALKRIAHYKRLIAPMKMDIKIEHETTTLDLEWLDKSVQPPSSLVDAELTFFVQLARLATRENILPLKVMAPSPPEIMDVYEEYFGVPIQRGPDPRLVFKAYDATRPFLSANERMWEIFEPDLRNRMAKLDQSATMVDRVRAALIELIPAGFVSLDSTAQKLGTSPRTLQRKLKLEGESFQNVLNKTREDLAKNYLKSTNISSSEISFLLGFEEPSSFFRAFQSWTGETPEQTRQVLHSAS